MIGAISLPAVPGMIVQWAGNRSGSKTLEGIGTWMLIPPGIIMFALSQSGKGKRLK